MRSAVAFQAGALVTTARHSPSESGVLAKAASGALEHIDHIEVRNLSDALKQLQAEGYQTVGLDSDGPEVLEDSFSGAKIALCARCGGQGPATEDAWTRWTGWRVSELGGEIPLAQRYSNAAAVAMYAARRHLGGAG